MLNIFKPKVKRHKNGFLYAKVKRKHCFKWGGYGVCDFCNQDFKEGYLVFVLNSCICPNCYNQSTIQEHEIDPEDDKFQKECAKDWYDYHFKNL